MQKDMMEQEHQADDVQGEPTTPTPSTPTTTTTRDGRQRPADPNDLGSPSDRSRGHAPGAHTPSPTHTVYSAHQGPTTQWRTGHYPSTTDTTWPQGGRATGEQTTRRQLVDPEPDHIPSHRTDYCARATDRTASTTSRQRPLSLDRTEYSTQNTDYSHMYRGATPTIEAEDEHQTHTPQAPPPRCTVHRLEQLLRAPHSAAARVQRWLTAAESDCLPPPPRPGRDFVASLRIVNGNLVSPARGPPSLPGPAWWFLKAAPGHALPTVDHRTQIHARMGGARCWRAVGVRVLPVVRNNARTGGSRTAIHRCPTRGVGATHPAAAHDDPRGGP